MLQPAERPALPDSHCARDFNLQVYKEYTVLGSVCVDKHILSGIY